MLRISFMAVALFVILYFSTATVRNATLLNGTIAIWLLIVVLRIVAVIVFPTDSRMMQSHREQAADIYSAIIRTVILAPAVALFYVIRVQSAVEIEGAINLNLLLELQLFWLVLNLMVVLLWIGMSYRKGGKWGY